MLATCRWAAAEDPVWFCLWHQLLEKEVEVAALEEDSKNLSCMSIAKEEEELAAHQAELEVLRSELQQISRYELGIILIATTILQRCSQ